jgi:Cu/Zn superoxide dismutase
VLVAAASGGGQLRVSVNLQGLDLSSTGGVHIHAGTTCADAFLVGGHYWTPTSDPDPWTTVMWTSNANGAATADFTVSTGYPLASNYGHAVVVHAPNGTRVGCGVLTSTSNAPTAVPTAPPTVAPTALVGPALIATIGAYPGYIGNAASGTVLVTAASAGQLRLSANLEGLPPHSTDGVHIHAGTSCDSASLVGGHYWTPLTDPDPWASVTWRSVGTGSAMAVYTVSTGYPLASNNGHAVVIHALNGTRVGCGLLVSTSNAPTAVPTTVPTFPPTVAPTAASSAQSGGHGSTSGWVSIVVPVLILAIFVCCAAYWLRAHYKAANYRDLNSGAQHDNSAFNPPSSEPYASIAVESPAGAYGDDDDNGVDEHGYRDAEA